MDCGEKEEEVVISDYSSCHTSFCNGNTTMNYQLKTTYEYTGVCSNGICEKQIKENECVLFDSKDCSSQGKTCKTSDYFSTLKAYCD